jgi:predicted RND superfamily exporter protein
LKTLLKFPKLVLLLISLVAVVFLSFATKLEIDASAETLLLEGDKDLALTRQLSTIYEAGDILVITYKPNQDLLDDKTKILIKNISNDLVKLSAINSITSILNVPLLQSPIRPIKELLKGIPTLQSTPNIDKKLVEKEFTTSALYSKNLVSEDFTTTAILINLKPNLTKKQNHENILNVRKVIKKYNQDNKLHLGGVSMIADDMVEFVKHDIQTFGLVVFAILVFILFVLFREIRWVIMPLLICTVSVIITSGLIYLLGWKISVISSNFISLLLIMNMSLIIHLAVKYLELLHKTPNESQYTIVHDSIKSMIEPSFFVVITTIAGFSSLVLSGIVPIIDFGWMMSIGITISLVLTFIMLPSMLILLPKSKVRAQKKQDKPFTYKVALFVQSNQKIILISWVLIVTFAITGAMKIFVENSFIDYFKKDTQIYQGMKVLDQKLGGTTPLDVVLTFKENNELKVEAVDSSSNSDEDDMLDEFDDEMMDDTQDLAEQYWFTSDKMDTIKKVHEYLDSLKATGKVLSLNTVASIGKIINENKDLDSLTLALLYHDLPLEYRNILLDPYLNIQHNQVRFATRIIDSQKDLRRDDLLKKINKDLNNMLNPKFEEFKITNLLVIYNNMLQSLFDSQIKTIGIVVLMLFIMFLILFRDIKLSLIAIVANTAPISVIFGFMGWMEIPLDMMTITIAAISIGIAVDNTIHYIHRFTTEYNSSQDYIASMFNSHASIGRAMFYTSLIIMIGFSVLVLSSFIPTIYFGLLTLLAMFMAIAADLLLLPVMLLLFKPFK